MKIKLDEHCYLHRNKAGSIEMWIYQGHNTKLQKDLFRKLYFPTYGNAVKHYIMYIQSGQPGIMSFLEMAKDIDKKLETVEKTINEQLKDVKE